MSTGKRLNPRWDELLEELREGQRIAESEEKSGGSAAWGNKAGDHKFNAEEMQSVFHRLDRFTAPAPGEDKTCELVNSVTVRMRVSVSNDGRFSDQWLGEKGDAAESGFIFQSLLSRLYRLLLSQVHVFSWLFWVVSVSVIGFGAWLVPQIQFGNIDPFAAAATVLSGGGILYALRSLNQPMAELEETFPVTPVQLIVGRMSIILFYDIFLALAATIVLALFGYAPDIPVFIASWLIPLCLCMALAVALMFRFGTWISSIVSLIVWAGQITAKEHLGPFYFLSRADYVHWLSSKLLAVALTAALLLYILPIFKKQGFYQRLASL
jgi:hypothetical protein